MSRDTKSTPRFGAVVKKFADAGISPKYLIPVTVPGGKISRTSQLAEKSMGKAPGVYIAATDEWTGLGYGPINGGATEHEHRRWADFPTANVGMLGLKFPAIDIDAESSTALAMVEKAIIRTFGKDHGAVIRYRGKNHRRLYAFMVDDPKKPVRGRHADFTPAKDVKSKIDIIGAGNQFVANGTHPSGDLYEWDKACGILDSTYPIRKITNEDINAFFDELKALVEAGGGTFNVSRGRGHGEAIDVADLDPVMSLEDAVKGLEGIPNTEENFPTRDDFVAVLSMFRAALGRDADTPQAEDAAREWACRSAWDDEWCPEEYFEKAWNSLSSVRTDQDALERLFRRNGMHHTAAAAFPNDAETANATVQQAKAERKEKQDDILAEVADEFVFRDANALDRLDSAMVRSRDNIEHEVRAFDWWRNEAVLGDTSLLADIQKNERWPRNKEGLAVFLRDIRTQYPRCFFQLECRDPGHQAGDVVTRVEDGRTYRHLNVRHQSRAVTIGSKPSKNPARDERDVAVIIKLVEGLFGAHADYELDTLAYMAQKTLRPGAMLFLVGDPGVGKSIYIELLSYMFDGNVKGRNMIDGVKMANEGSRRFAYASIEGCRIVSHRELPRNMRKATMAEITAGFKTLVDSGMGGDWVTIEAKNQPVRAVPNVCRVIVSSNYLDAMEIEEHDRRIFLVQSALTANKKLRKEEYAELSAISKDSERLAAFWRYLLSRNISKFNAYAPPPSTSAKLQMQLEASESPEKRHFMSAVALFEHSGRNIFTNVELFETMSRMAVNERDNSHGRFDDVVDYRRLKMASPAGRAVANAFRAMPSHHFVKLDREIRDQNRNRINVYFVGPDAQSIHARLAEENIPVILDEWKLDKSQHGLIEHPVELYRDNDTE